MGVYFAQKAKEAAAGGDPTVENDEDDPENLDRCRPQAHNPRQIPVHIA